MLTRSIKLYFETHSKNFKFFLVKSNLFDTDSISLILKFVKLGSAIIGGKGGGGRKDFAQAGGQDQNKIDEAFEKIKSLI